MDDSHDDEADLSPAGEVFAEFLAQVEDGTNPDFDALCALHADLTAELRRLHASWLEFVAPLPERHTSSSDDAERADRLIESLREPDGGERYEDRGEVGRGGMGEVRAAYDRKLRRTLAIKTLLRAGGAEGSRGLARFLDEARISAQLDHPGIVPVHELGLDSNGRVFFSMPLIRGRDLGQVYASARRGDGEWTRERVLASLLRVCEAVAFAHSRRVLHRDLKPANVMVGPFGETYVMDWGLAKVFGSDDPRADGTPVPETYRGTEPGDAPPLTGEGAVVGTPAYLAPEQAAGQPVDERADVYSIGAMLYELLTGQKPYADRDDPPRAAAVLSRLSQGPPIPVRALTSDVPPELEAICERAMAWAVEQRYESVSALAGDLRAYLEGRVVAAYETGALAELRKWVQRNRATAVAAGAAVLLAVVGSVGIGWSETVRRAEIEAKNVELEASRSEEARQAAIARTRTAEVLRLSDLGRLDDLERRAGELWPLRPGLQEELSGWITEAEALVARGAGEHGPMLSALRARAQPYSTAERDRDERDQEGYTEREWYREKLATQRAGLDGFLARREAGETSDELQINIDNYSESVAMMEASLAALETVEFERLTWTFAAAETQWEHDTLATLVQRIDELALPEGRLDDVRWRLRELERLTVATLEGDDARSRWAAAIGSIADETASPAYGGLHVEPQFGLLPIGRDSRSGLWEFVHLQSGAEPRRHRESGELEPSEDMGIVLVLVPGGRYVVGAQRTVPGGPNHDPTAASKETPVHAAVLDPFFLAKYELTQSQWVRARGTNPSDLRPGRHLSERPPGKDATLLHPVETVTWSDSVETLRQLGLVLPTEAQWEAAGRAGTDTPWFTGAEIETLAGHVNAADRVLQASGRRALEVPILDWLDDGYALHGPVGSYLPNPFGLHDVLGNVSEWCRDDFSPYPNWPRAGDGLRTLPFPADRVARGGGCSDSAAYLRVSSRANMHGEAVDATIGVRPARPLESGP